MILEDISTVLTVRKGLKELKIKTLNLLVKTFGL